MHKWLEMFYKGPDKHRCVIMACLICLLSTWCRVCQVSAPYLRKRSILQVFCVRLRKGKEGEKMSLWLAILRLVLLVLFGLSFGGRGEIGSFSNVFKVLTCSLLPSFLHFSAWPESGWSFRPLVVLHAHTPSFAERQCGSSLSSCILSRLRGHESILYQH